MLTRAKAFGLVIAALLILTLVPGAPTTAAPGTRIGGIEANYFDGRTRNPPILPIRRSPVHPLSPTAGATTRVSVASDGGQGNGDSRYSSISADGRYVAFRSWASNLVGGDTNSEQDIFVHDRQTGQTTRVSVASDGGQGNYDSQYPSISADGRYVAFDSWASNLVGGDTNGGPDVFVHDRQTGQTARVSVASDGGQGNDGSYWPSISADGRYVAFYSWASNLVGGDTNGCCDIFVHDRGGRGAAV